MYIKVQHIYRYICIIPFMCYNINSTDEEKRNILYEGVTVSTHDRKAYYKQYREKNRERLREYARQWRSEHAEEYREKRAQYARDWRRRNPDKVKAAQARYWAKQEADTSRQSEAL